jgi:predicted enzyme related to lactoylglutathione lyase
VPNERVHFEGSQPILRVEDMKRAVEFYVEKLGFKNAEWAMEEFTSVNRDKAGIYLCLGGQGLGKAWVWVGVQNVVRLREEIMARGVKLRMEPTNYPWAKEIHVEDPDGNVIRFGSEPDAE